MLRSRTVPRTWSVLAAVVVAVAACTGSNPTVAPSVTQPSVAAPSVAAPSVAAPSVGATTGSGSNGGTLLYTTKTCEGAITNSFFDETECEKELGLRTVKPTGPDDQPWIQMLSPQMVDTTKYKKAGPYTLCVSESGEDNPWRVVGWNTMQHEAALEGVTIKHDIAGGKDDKQISDIADEVSSGQCSALVISPNSTAALTPAVESACKSNIPVIVWDRGVTTDCPVTFIHPIGGYAFGADAAEYLASVLPAGSKVIATRILPGVDVLETRFLGAQAVFAQHQITISDAQFTGGDPAKTKTIVADDLTRFGSIDGIWADAGATSVAASEAIEEAGIPMIPIIGEDQNDFLVKWSDKGYPWFSSTYPVWQWRTAIIAATDILKGQQVPSEWILPQPVITSDTLSQWVAPQMPGLFYASCGCQKMDGFPADWQK
jgi:ribose transport system substrate-binding protein